MTDSFDFFIYKYIDTSNNLHVTQYSQEHKLVNTKRKIMSNNQLIRYHNLCLKLQPMSHLHVH